MRDPQNLIQEGLAALNGGRAEVALPLFKKALSQRPRDVELLHLAAVACMELRDLKPGRRYLEKALKLAPAHAHANNTLGIFLMQEGQQTRALEAFRKAVTADPANIQALGNLARSLRDLDYPGEALETYLKLGELVPEDAHVQNLIGLLYQNHGRFAEAISHLRKAITLEPGLGGAWTVLAEIDPDISDTDIALIQQILGHPGTPPGQAAQLSAALFRVYERRRDFDHAGPVLLQANKLLRQTYNYDVLTDEQKMVDIANAMNRAFLAEAIAIDTDTSTRPDDPHPLFVLGMPRSGTTLVEQILSSHSAVGGAGEIGTFHRALAQNKGFQAKGFPACLEGWKEKDYRQLRQFITDQLVQAGTNTPLVTDKTPENFLYIGLIKKLWPDARIIHCTRNAMDCAWSIYKTPFREGNWFAADQAELVRYYRAYEKLMDHWRLVCGDNILDVSYEDMIDDQEGQTWRLLDWCGLDREDACLQFHENKRPVRTASSVQIRSPIYRTSLKAWQPFASHLQTLIKELGRH